MFEEIEIGDVYNENEDELLETIEELEKEVKFYLAQGNKTAAKLIQQQIKDIKKVHF
jgi:tartrate dehydratase beta subunit/fumarate hydratase class I family protein